MCSGNIDKARERIRRARCLPSPHHPHHRSLSLPSLLSLSLSLSQGAVLLSPFFCLLNFPLLNPPTCVHVLNSFLVQDHRPQGVYSRQHSHFTSIKGERKMETKTEALAKGTTKACSSKTDRRTRQEQLSLCTSTEGSSQIIK